MNPKYPACDPVFLIGASAGGVKALLFLAEYLPKDFPAPLFFLLHRRRGGIEVDLLPKLLSSRSKLHISVPQTGETARPGTIYLPLLEHHLTVKDTLIVQDQHASEGKWRPSIDALFISGARTYRERTVAVLLTGRLNDGIEGLIEVTKKGGLSVAQSPEDAFEPIMPLNALLHDHPSYVLPLKDMPALFCELAQHAFSSDQKDILLKSAQAAAKKKENIQKLTSHHYTQE